MQNTTIYNFRHTLIRETPVKGKIRKQKAGHYNVHTYTDNTKTTNKHKMENIPIGDKQERRKQAEQNSDNESNNSKHRRKDACRLGAVMLSALSDHHNVQNETHNTTELKRFIEDISVGMCIIQCLSFQ